MNPIPGFVVKQYIKLVEGLSSNSEGSRQALAASFFCLYFRAAFDDKDKEKFNKSEVDVI